MIHSSTLHSLPRSREQEYLAGWQRARAELDNFRKRLSAQQADQQLRTRRELVTPLLDLADTFETMAEHLPLELKSNAWAQGVTHVARQLQKLLQDYGVVTISNVVGCQFDPSQHEAVSHVQHKNTKSGHIIEVVQAGYKMGDTLIRPAKVRVAR